LRLKIESSAGKGPNSARLAELRAELDAVKELLLTRVRVNRRKQAGLKSGKSGLVQQIETLKVKIEREQNDLKLKRGKIAYRSTDEVDREIRHASPNSRANSKELGVRSRLRQIKTCRRKEKP